MSKIGIFAGSDLFTASVLPNVLSGIRELGMRAHVYFPKAKSFAPTTHPALRKYRIVESELLSDVVHPILDHHPVVNNALCFSPFGLAKKSDCPVALVENINADAFLDQLESEKIDSILSIRCLQIFSKEFLMRFEKKSDGFLWNLHCGPLPTLRGAMPIFWTMLHEKTHATLSLHEIVSKVDKGRVADAVATQLEPGLSLLETTCQPVDAAVELILRSIKNHNEGLIQFSVQNEAIARYYSYPTYSDIERFLQSGQQMLPPDPIHYIVDKYSAPGSALSQDLHKKLQAHTQELERSTQDSPYKYNALQSDRFFSPQSEKKPGEHYLSYKETPPNNTGSYTPH